MASDSIGIECFGEYDILKENCSKKKKKKEKTFGQV